MAQDTAHLVQAASAGGRDATEELLARFLPELRAFVRLRAGSGILRKESDDDLVQSVCRDVLQQGLSCFEYRGLPAFKNWLYTRALHKIYDKAKFYARDKRDGAREQAFPTDPQYLSGFASLLTPSSAVAQNEDVARLQAAFDSLPDESREVITLHKIVGLTHAEIATQLGKSEGATRVALHRGLARLGVLLEREDS